LRCKNTKKTPPKRKEKKGIEGVLIKSQENSIAKYPNVEDLMGLKAHSHNIPNLNIQTLPRTAKLKNKLVLKRNNRIDDS
jgi:hypothetical protein